MLAVAFEHEQSVHEVFQDAGAGQSAVFGHVTNQEHGYSVPLRGRGQGLAGIPDLPDVPGSPSNCPDTTVWMESTTARSGLSRSS